MSTLVTEKKLAMFTDTSIAWMTTTDYFVRNFLTGDQRWNYPSLNDKALEDLAQTARFTQDQAQYDVMAKKLVSMVAAAAPEAFLWQPSQDAVVVPNIEGYTYWFHRQVDYRDMYRNSVTKLGAVARLAGQRLLSSLPALLGVVIFTFVLMRVLPGDPAVFFSSGPSAGKQEIEQLRHQMGLDRSIPVQLAFYLRDIATGSLGHSMTTGQDVTKDLRERLPASLELTFTALIMALGLAIPLGVLAALRPNSLVDHAVRLFCTLGVCVPTFVSGLLLIYVFYYLAGIAPDPTGRIDVFASVPPTVTGFLTIDGLLAGDFDVVGAALSQLLLPAATMALFVLAPLARMTRAAMLAVLGSDYIRTARAMGLSRSRIIIAYALRNAALPVLTIAGIVFSTMLGANVLVEKVFSWPGVAAYALDALLASDYAPVQGFVLLMASVFVVVNLLVDVLYGLADPRVAS